MRRGLRYLPASPTKGRRRITALGLGVLAALSLIWQQQATLASYVDVEFAKATFSAATLDAIAPDTTARASRIDIDWAAASGDWATPQYTLDWSSFPSGSGMAELYSGTGTSATHSIGSAATSGRLVVTKVSTGGTQSCALAQGRVFCWGANTNGALGLGTTTSTNVPREVGGVLAGKTVTDISVGTNHACAVADGNAYCWGLATSGRLGNGTTTGTYTSPVAVSTGAMGGTVTSISAGDTHTCATADGNAYCWGNGSNGRLGRGSTTTASTPVAVVTSGVLSGRTVTAISAGTSHSCAVADGLAFCWGLGTNGRLGNASTSGNYTSPVAVSTATGLADRTVTSVSAGNTHTCAVVDGTAYCWGSPTYGRLGNGATSGDVGEPVTVTATMLTAGSVTAINAGSTHTCAISDGTAYCWGYNNYGQLGDNTVTRRTTPVPVSTAGVLGGRSVTSISAGASVSCVVGDSLGSCWGLGTSGQLGNSASSTSRVPVDAAVNGLTCPAGAVLVGSDCSLVQGSSFSYRLDYSIGSWTAPASSWVTATTKTRAAVEPSATAKTSTSLTLGWDAVSELSQSYAEYTVQRSTSSSGSSPVTVYKGGLRSVLDRGGLATRASILTVDQLSAGADHTCALLEGSVYCWGDNTDGELGINSTTDASVPTAVTTTSGLGGTSISSLSAGENHTCAVADGTVYCWGYNGDGRSGGTATADKLVPTAVAGVTNATQVTSGWWHTCALADGKVWCWGDNTRGQIGDGTTTTSRATPVQVGGLLAGKTVSAVSAGGAHTCAIASGVVYCWGSNVSGQLGINTSGSATNSSVPVAMLASGSFTNTNVTELSAGYAHSCAISSGKLFCWGYNASGQIGNNGTALALVATAVNTPWAANAALGSVAAGQYHSCVSAAGKAYCWGENANGQLGDGSTINRTVPVAVTASGPLSGTVSQISAGGLHACAVSGTAAYCWGSNTTGQVGDGSTTQRTAPVAVQTVAGAPCATGASLITPSTCSLAPGTTYYYRVKFTVDGAISTTSDWVGIKTSS